MNQIKLSLAIFLVLAAMVNSRSISQEIEDAAHNIKEGVNALEDYVEQLNASPQRHHIAQLIRSATKIKTSFQDGENNLKKELNVIEDKKEELLGEVRRLEARRDDKNRDLEQTNLKISNLKNKHQKHQTEHDDIEADIGQYVRKVAEAKAKLGDISGRKKLDAFAGNLARGYKGDDEALDSAIDTAVDTGVDWAFDKLGQLFGRKKREAEEDSKALAIADFIDRFTKADVKRQEGLEESEKRKLESLGKRLKQKKVQLSEVNKELRDEEQSQRGLERHIEELQDQLSVVRNDLSKDRRILKELNNLISKTRTSVTGINELHNHAQSLYDTTEWRKLTYSSFGTFHGAADDVIDTARALSRLVDSYPELGSALLTDAANDIINKCNKIKQLLERKKPAFSGFS